MFYLENSGQQRI